MLEAAVLRSALSVFSSMFGGLGAGGALPGEGHVVLAVRAREDDDGGFHRVPFALTPMRSDTPPGWPNQAAVTPTGPPAAVRKVISVRRCARCLMRM